MGQAAIPASALANPALNGPEGALSGGLRHGARRGFDRRRAVEFTRLPRRGAGDVAEAPKRGSGPQRPPG